jgi:hypothetical protein
VWLYYIYVLLWYNHTLKSYDLQITPARVIRFTSLLSELRYIRYLTAQLSSTQTLTRMSRMASANCFVDLLGGVYDSSTDASDANNDSDLHPGSVPHLTNFDDNDDASDELQALDAILASTEAETEMAIAIAEDMDIADDMDIAIDDTLHADLLVPNMTSPANDRHDIRDGSSSNDRDIATRTTTNSETHSQMLSPPTNQSFNTPEEAMEAINIFTGLHGYALTKKRSKNDDFGNPKVIYLQCNRGGTFNTRIEKEDRKRKRSIRSIGCPFDAVLRFSKELLSWSLEIRDPTHNHEPSPPSTHPSLRRQELNAKAARIEAQIALGMPTRQVLSGIEKEARSSLKAQDIRNLRKMLRRQFLKGRSPIQALITQLPEDGNWNFSYELSEDYHVTTLFGMHKSSLDILRMNPYMLFMDCTYKTNRFKMPLLDIVGVTATNKTFYVGFAFLGDEKQPSYEFVLRNLKCIYSQLNLSIIAPATVLTDKDRALINALHVVFPETNTMVCQWHIHMDILKKARPILGEACLRVLAPTRVNDPEFIKQWKKAVHEKWTTMLADWGKVEQASTLEGKDNAWAAFKVKYSDIAFRPIIDYIQVEWLDDTVVFLNCETNRYLHFDNRATSRNESAHWILKQDLQASTHDLLSATLSFERTVSYQHRQFEQKLADQRVTRPVHLLGFLYRDVITKVSQFALEKVESIRKQFLPIGAPTAKPIPYHCTGNTTRTTGVPCIHIIKEYIDQNRSLPLDQFHQQWHLYPANEVAPLRIQDLVLEPLVVRRRGRPAGSLNNPVLPASLETSSQDLSTQRDPSAFEYALSQEENRGRRGRGVGTRARNSGRNRGRGRGSGRTQEQDTNSGGNDSNGGNRGGNRGRGRGRGRPRGRPRGRGRGLSGLAPGGQHTNTEQSTEQNSR